MDTDTQHVPEMTNAEDLVVLPSEGWHRVLLSGRVDPLWQEVPGVPRANPVLTRLANDEDVTLIIARDGDVLLVLHRQGEPQPFDKEGRSRSCAVATLNAMTLEAVAFLRSALHYRLDGEEILHESPWSLGSCQRGPDGRWFRISHLEGWNEDWFKAGGHCKWVIPHRHMTPEINTYKWMNLSRVGTAAWEASLLGWEPKQLAAIQWHGSVIIESHDLDEKPRSLTRWDHPGDTAFTFADQITCDDAERDSSEPFSPQMWVYGIASGVPSMGS